MLDERKCISLCERRCVKSLNLRMRGQMRGERARAGARCRRAVKLNDTDDVAVSSWGFPLFFFSFFLTLYFSLFIQLLRSTLAFGQRPRRDDLCQYAFTHMEDFLLLLLLLLLHPSHSNSRLEAPNPVSRPKSQS